MGGGLLIPMAVLYIKMKWIGNQHNQNEKSQPAPNINNTQPVIQIEMMAVDLNELSEKHRNFTPSLEAILEEPLEIVIQTTGDSTSGDRSLSSDGTGLMHDPSDDGVVGVLEVPLTPPICVPMHIDFTRDIRSKSV